MQKYLPSGAAFKDSNRFIYDEKNIFATRGKAKDPVTGRRGADSRMAYNEDLKELVEVVARWIMEGCDPWSLYTALYELNDKFGYGHQYYDASSIAFQKAVMKNKG